jgi:hypothetical protein
VKYGRNAMSLSAQRNGNMAESQRGENENQ